MLPFFILSEKTPFHLHCAYRNLPAEKRKPENTELTALTWRFLKHRKKHYKSRHFLSVAPKQPEKWR